MAYKSSHELHHYFPKVAEETGFTFNTHRPRVHVDWNKIRSIDTDSLVKDRKFHVIEQHLNDILNCGLESEFDVRILDEGVIKMFRLAQLAVEYQQFCRQYLDRSVIVLRQEITSLAQTLDVTKRNLQEKEDELKKIKKITKHNHKHLLPYGNDNIATMILKTLGGKGVILPTSSNGDNYHHNQCNHCGKVFLNQLYLQSHISRRHPNVVEIPQKDNITNDQNNENVKLSSEITILKNKLKEVEALIPNTTQRGTSEVISADLPKHESFHNANKVMKDAEVSTNSESYFLDIIEKWKKVEGEEYNKEINKLRNQIMETVNSFKLKETKEYAEKDSKLMEQFHATITQQGAQILALKKELDNSKMEAAHYTSNISQEAETQISMWSKRIEAQSRQYELLLQKLTNVAKDAKESHALAIAEREKASKLQDLLQQSITKVTENFNDSTDNGKRSSEVIVQQIQPKAKVSKNSLSDTKSIENLHRKAQALLNIGSLSSSFSDLSSTDSQKHPVNLTDTENVPKLNVKTQDNSRKDIKCKSELINKSQISGIPAYLRRKTKEKNRDMSKVQTNSIQQSTTNTGSPIKVVRAKLTEEVNNRLVALGIDPLKCRLPQKIFHDQRTQLQRLLDEKSKKNRKYENQRHTILAYLDSNTDIQEKEEICTRNDILQQKDKNIVPYLSSVISGVKSKGLSIVKSHDTQNNRKFEVTEQALSLPKSSPGTATHSPQRNLIAKTHTVNETQDNSNNLSSKRKLNKTKRTYKMKSSKNKNEKTQTANSKSESLVESDQYCIDDVIQISSKVIENLIKSPARRPPINNTDFKQASVSHAISETNNFNNSQSATNLNGIETDSIPIAKVVSLKNFNDNKDLGLLSTAQVNKATSEENISKQTKGVLKNASSTSTLNKKKVIFDMDAIQMKSLSASPSQSITDRSNTPHNYVLGLGNLDDEDWDISSIENNDPLKNDTKLQFRKGTSPKILELRNEIESQLARRVSTTSLVGAVDVLGLGLPVSKVASTCGSNTSLGSSILDESESRPAESPKAFETHTKILKDDSDSDTSNYSLDGIIKSDENGAF